MCNYKMVTKTYYFDRFIRGGLPAYIMPRKPQRTIRPTPAWCSACKKTRRGVKTPEGFRCRTCAEAMGFNVKGRVKNSFTSATAKAARAAQIATANATLEAAAAAKKAAATRRRKAAEAARKALLDGMVKVSSLPASFVARMNGVCKGCKGRLPVPSVEWIEARPGRVPSVVCSECAEKVSA